MERFSSSLNGYNVKEVNDFVDTTAREYASMLDKLKSKDAEIFKLENELKKYKNMYENMNRATLASTETSNTITQMSRNEARMIIEDAKRNASRIVNEALLEAERIEMRAEQVRRNMVVFKRRMRAIIQTQIQTIEDIEDVKLDD